MADVILNLFISSSYRMKTNIVGMEVNMEQLLDKACAKFLIFVLVEICPFNRLLCECQCLRFYQFIADNDCAIKK